MKKIFTLLFATLFVASTGAFAASHMKADKDAPKAGAKKGGDMKSDAKKGGDKKDGKKK